MQLFIDIDSEVPIYQQIRDGIVEAIADGKLEEGDPLPSMRQLGKDLAINFHTVNKAYDLLRQQGLVRINRKSGAVVRRDGRSGPPEAGFAKDWRERMRPLLAEAVVRGLSPEEALGQCGEVLESFGAADEAWSG